MWKQLAAGLVLAVLAGPALAFSCPALMAEIDEALADDSIVSSLSDAERNQVRDLRREGEVLHNEGDHNASEDALNEARAILGVDNGGGGGSYY